MGWGQLAATWPCGVPLVLPSIAPQPYRARLGARKGGPWEAMHCRIPASFPTLSQLLLVEPKPP